MKIYAIRDRLLDYFQQPFVGPTDKQVLAGLGQAINSPENMNAISQAPHHYELWELGSVDEETGAITPHRAVVADCASLVRGGVRGAGTDRPGAVTGGEAPGGHEKPPERRAS